METKIVEEYRIISTGLLVKAIKEGKDNSSERFCFIIGSGASVSSGIPSGIELERDWMNEMENDLGLGEIRANAKKLKENNLLENDFEEIEKAWKETKESGVPLPSKFYFDIYTLRFFPNHRSGYYYFEQIMENKQPSFGYHPLALTLTDGSGNNLVITTNFDSLVEDALFMYTNSKPLVINHELLADFAGDPNIKRPIIAKVHRGIFFDPLNKPEETNKLKGKWHDILASIFQYYTPVVIGYGGGDNSLMDLLEEENVKMKNGIYWCYVEEHGLPNEKIQNLVKNKKGYLVSTAGFDATMLAIGNALFPDKIGVHETEEYLDKRTSTHIENYEKEYEKLVKLQETNNAEKTKAPTTQSEDDFRKEIEKMTERGTNSENKRKTSNQMTAWDYWRQGNRYYYIEKNYKKAIESYSHAIHMLPSKAMLYVSRGTARARLLENDNAVSDYNKAIELDPNYANAYYNRGDVYHTLENYDKAVSDYNKAIELDPNDAFVYCNRGLIYNKLGNYDKAVSDYNKAIELDPNYANAYYNRGNVYYTLENYDKAVSDYNKAIELDPNDAFAYGNRGLVYGKLGNYDKAFSDYNKSIELNPNDAVAYCNRGGAYCCLMEYEKALLECNKAIELDSNFAVAYINRSEVYNNLGEYEKAIIDCNKAIELDPNLAESYNNRGCAYNNMGEYDNAISDCNKAINLKPHDAEPYKHCGVAWKNKSDYKKAVELLTKAIELNIKYKEAYKERAEVYKIIGEIEKSTKDEEVVEKLNAAKKLS